MLTPNDYRAVLLQNYRLYRNPNYAPKMSKRFAYEMALAVVNRLPGDEATWLVSEALREYPRFRELLPDECGGNPRVSWNCAYRKVRKAAHGTGFYDF